MKDIYIFTNSFPYTKSVEVFIEDEIEIVSKLGYNIFIIPTNKDSYIRDYPQNIKIMPCLLDTNLITKIILLVSMFFESKFWKMIIEAKSFKKIIQGIKYYFGASLTKNYIKKNILKPSVLYSYWFSYTALGIAMAKEKNTKIGTCVSRGHGYDIFDDARNIYIPLREFTLTQLDKIYSVSKIGADYMKSRFPKCSKKIDIYHLGIKPITPCVRDINPENISIVSCSSMIQLKRVDLIFEMIKTYCLNHNYIQISWTHFGSGIMHDEIEKLCKTAPSNMNICLKGFVNNNEIHKSYSEYGFDIFVNMSTTEGIPVSIMEAISAGIPVIATDVGGNKEIVAGKNGIIIPENVKYDDFEFAMNTIIANHQEMKANAIEHFNNNFNANVNYPNFYKLIQSL